MTETSSSDPRFMTVGRAVDCDICINHPSVSGHHADLWFPSNGHPVLQDAGSRNGLYQGATRERSIQKLDLIEGETVYFGQHPVPATWLIRQAQFLCDREVHSASQRNSPSPQRSVSKHRRLWTAVSIGAGMLLLAGFAAVLGLPTGAIVQPVASPSSSGTQTALATAGPVPSDDPAIMDSAAETSVEAPSEMPPTSTETSESERLARSLVWIIATQKSSGDRYCLGTGVVIKPRSVLTTASIVSAMNHLIANGFESPEVISLADQRSVAILESGVSPAYQSRSSLTKRLRAEFQQVSQEIRDAQVEDSGGQEAMDRIARMINSSIEAQNAADVGWLGLSESLSAIELDTSIRYRPAQRLSVWSGNLIQDDPFYDPQLAPRVDPLAVRMERQSASLEGIAGVLNWSLVTPAIGGLAGRPPSNSASSQNLIGCPLIRAGKLVGLVVAGNAEGLEAISSVSLRSKFLELIP